MRQMSCFHTRSVRHARALSRGVLKPCISGTNEKKCLRKVRKSSVTSTPAFSTRNAFLFFCDVLALGTRRHASSARTAILRFRAMLRPKVPHPLRKSLIADRQIQHSTRHFAAPLAFYAAAGGAAYGADPSDSAILRRTHARKRRNAHFECWLRCSDRASRRRF